MQRFRRRHRSGVGIPMRPPRYLHCRIGNVLKSPMHFENRLAVGIRNFQVPQLRLRQQAIRAACEPGAAFGQSQLAAFNTLRPFISWHGSTIRSMSRLCRRPASPIEFFGDLRAF